MSITLDFNLLGHKVWALELNVAGEEHGASPVNAVVDKSVKWFSHKWTSRLFR